MADCPAMPRIIRSVSDGVLQIAYTGTVQALLAAGAVMAKLIAPVHRGRQRCDVAGSICLIELRPNDRLRVIYYKAEDRAASLPGVADWLALEAGVPLDVRDPVTALAVAEAIRKSGKIHGSSNIGINDAYPLYFAAMRHELRKSGLF